MKPVDKRGRPIYGKTWDTILAHGHNLLRLGYREARSKPNLFFRKAEEGVCFADLRGTDIIAIWEDPRPMFYARFQAPRWKQNRLMREELERLREGGCAVRQSFYVEGEWEESDDWDGYCKECEKDFRRDGLFCSKECEERDRRRRAARRVIQSPMCAVCQRRIVESDYSGWNPGNHLGEDLPRRLIVHHVSYEPEETIEVCQGCHNRIHHGKDPQYERWKPRDRSKGSPDADTAS